MFNFITMEILTIVVGVLAILYSPTTLIGLVKLRRIRKRMYRLQNMLTDVMIMQAVSMLSSSRSEAKPAPAKAEPEKFEVKQPTMEEIVEEAKAKVKTKAKTKPETATTTKPKTPKVPKKDTL